MIFFICRRYLQAYNNNLIFLTVKVNHKYIYTNINIYIYVYQANIQKLIYVIYLLEWCREQDTPSLNISLGRHWIFIADGWKENKYS